LDTLIDTCPTLIDFDFDLDEVIFQQDNASAHKAKIV
jgi:hypothetical protein